jgi:putative copper resistance protein D
MTSSMPEARPETTVETTSEKIPEKIPAASADPRPRRFRPVDATLVAAAVVVAAGLAGLLGGVLTGPDTAGRDAVVLAGTVLARSAMDVAAVVCVGLALVPVLLGRVAAETRPVLRADRALVAAAGGWLVSAVLGIALRTADALGRAPGELTVDQMLAWSTRLLAGRGMLGTAGCAVVVLACAVARVRRPGAVPALVPLVLSVAGVALAPMTGHALAEDQGFTVVATMLHAGAAALWVGGLGALLVLVAPHGALLDGVLPRYSTLAGDCLIVLVISGVFTTAVRLGGWAPLVGTGYGLLILAKAVLLVALAGLGGLARRRLHTGRRPVLRWAGVEVVVMAVVIGVAATLSQTPPPGTASAAHGHVSPPPAAVDLRAARLAPLGPVVVDGGSRVLYRFDADSTAPPASTCITPACTAVWEPVLTDDRPAAGHGVDPDLIGTTVRPDGTRQVTLGGRPLYRRAGEPSGPTGGGSHGADGAWFVVAPDGTRAAG